LQFLQLLLPLLLLLLLDRRRNGLARRRRRGQHRLAQHGARLEVGKRRSLAVVALLSRSLLLLLLLLFLLPLLLWFPLGLLLLRGLRRLLRPVEPVMFGHELLVVLFVVQVAVLVARQLAAVGRRRDRVLEIGEVGVGVLSITGNFLGLAIVWNDGHHKRRLGGLLLLLLLLLLLQAKTFLILPILLLFPSLLLLFPSLLLSFPLLLLLLPSLFSLPSLLFLPLLLLSLPLLLLLFLLLFLLSLLLSLIDWLLQLLFFDLLKAWISHGAHLIFAESRRNPLDLGVPLEELVDGKHFAGGIIIVLLVGVVAVGWWDSWRRGISGDHSSGIHSLRDERVRELGLLLLLLLLLGDILLLPAISWLLLVVVIVNLCRLESCQDRLLLLLLLPLLLQSRNWSLSVSAEFLVKLGEIGKLIANESLVGISSGLIGDHLTSLQVSDRRLQRRDHLLLLLFLLDRRPLLLRSLLLLLRPLLKRLSFHGLLLRRLLLLLTFRLLSVLDCLGLPLLLQNWLSVDDLGVVDLGNQFALQTVPHPQRRSQQVDQQLVHVEAGA